MHPLVEVNVKKIGKMKIHLSLLILFWGLIAQAQDPKVSIEASSTEVSLGQQFDIVLKSTISGSGEIELPASFEVIQVYRGSNATILNGKRTQEISRYYTIRPLKEGSFTIPAVKWNISGGGVTKSNSLKINVRKPGSTSGAQNSSYTSHYVELRSSKKQVYAGEPFHIKAVAYARTDIYDQAYKPADLPDFIVRTPLHAAGTDFPIKQETKDGVLWNTKLVFEEILVPNQSGTVNIEPIQVSLGVVKDIFSIRYLNLFTNELNIKVLPLPTGAPEGFTGVIGAFEIESKNNIKDNKLNVGEVFTFSVRVSGVGNFRAVKPFELRLPDGLVLYGDPKVDNQVLETEQGFVGHIDYEYVVQIEKPGTYKFLPLDFVFFNPESKRYQTLNVSELSFKAEGEPIPQSSENPELSNNLNFTQSNSGVSWIWIVASAVLGFVAIIFTLRYFLQKNRKNAPVKKNLKTKTEARDSALKALASLNTDDAELLNQVEKIILQFFKDYTNDESQIIGVQWFDDHAISFGLTHEASLAWQDHFSSIQAMKYANLGQSSVREIKEITYRLIENMR